MRDAIDCTKATAGSDCMLTAGLLTSPEIDRIFSAASTLQTMLDVEAALSRVEAELGVVPAAAAAAIADACRQDNFDLAGITAETRDAGNPAIPLVKALTRIVADSDASAAGFVHWGATSQDIIDTAMMLQCRRALECIDRSLCDSVLALAAMARTHRRTPMAARTLGQQALPTSFGLKAANWLRPLAAARETLTGINTSLPVQFGGAAGTLAALRSPDCPFDATPGLDVARALAAALDLQFSPPWHTNRTPVTTLAGALGGLGASIGKIVQDLLLLMQTEIGEVHERGDGGGSSTLPHKRNPVALVAAAAACRRIPGAIAGLLSAAVQEQERGTGGWHAEWILLHDLFDAVATAVAQLQMALARLDIDVDAMRRNLDHGAGMLMAEQVAMRLAPKLGRAGAQSLVREAAEQARLQNCSLAETVAERMAAQEDLAPMLTKLPAWFASTGYLGDADAIIDLILNEAGQGGGQ